MGAFIRSVTILTLVSSVAAPAAATRPAAAADPPAVQAARRAARGQIAALGMGTNAGEHLGDVGFAEDGLFVVFGGPLDHDTFWGSLAEWAGPGYTVTAKLGKLDIVPAADGKSAWLAYDATVRIDAEDPRERSTIPFRASEVVVQTEDGWQVAALFWSMPVADKKAHADAAAGKLAAREALAEGSADVGPSELLGSVGQALRDGTLAGRVASRPDVLTIGSAPKEWIKGGGKLAKALAAWGGAARVDGPLRAGLAPSGTTGWVLANLAVAKQKGEKRYEIPFRVLFVVDKVGGEWKVVQAHLAVLP